MAPPVWPERAGSVALLDRAGSVAFELEDSKGFDVLEDEQAQLYCCWAESVFLKFRHEPLRSR